jgi:uncharacterized membrane protein (UPF0127 family)
MAVELDPANPSRTYDSAGPARYVIEVVGGTWKRIGAKPGDIVTFSNLPTDAPEPED